MLRELEPAANAPLALPPGLAKAPVLDDVADIALPADHPLARAAVEAFQHAASATA